MGIQRRDNQLNLKTQEEFFEEIESKLKSKGFSIKGKRMCTSFGWKVKIAPYEGFVLEKFEWVVRVRVEEKGQTTGAKS